MSSHHELADGSSASDKPQNDNVLAENLIIIDDEGDLILRIQGGLESEDSEDEEQDREEDADPLEAREDNDLAEGVSNLVLMDVNGSDHVLVKVSKAQICASSDFFETMFSGPWAETQHKFSKLNPPIVILSEMNCGAAIAMLRTMHGLSLFSRDGIPSFELLKAIILLAERWMAVERLKIERLGLNEIGLHLLHTLPRASQGERDVLFKTHLVDLLDMMEIVGDWKSYKAVSWFILKHLKTGSCWSAENNFATETQTRKVLATVYRQAEFLRTRVVAAIINLFMMTCLDYWTSMICKDGCILLTPTIDLIMKLLFVCNDGVISDTPFAALYGSPLQPLQPLETIDPQTTKMFHLSLKGLAEMLISLRSLTKPTPPCHALSKDCLCCTCVGNIKKTLSTSLRDLNRLARPLCIFCFKAGWTNGRQFSFSCPNHDQQGSSGAKRWRILSQTEKHSAIEFSNYLKLHGLSTFRDDESTAERHKLTSTKPNTAATNIVKQEVAGSRIV